MTYNLFTACAIDHKHEELDVGNSETLERDIWYHRPMDGSLDVHETRWTRSSHCGTR